MITAGASAGFEGLLLQSLKKSMVVMPEDYCEVDVTPDSGGHEKTSVVVLTSSSYVFRVMVLIYFNDDFETKTHFARRTGVNAEDMQQQDFMDALCEAANMCSGGFNRELGRFYPHIGLSTPNILERSCADHLHALHAGLVRHFRVIVNSATLFHASMCVCDYDTIDFTYIAPAAEDTVAEGELEFF
jgi:hypothetical protein